VSRTCVSHTVTAFGVKRRAMSFRRSVWSGSSVPISAGSAGRFGRYPPFAWSELMKTSFAFSISRMSS
jgi:hypothetical protein